MVAYLLSNSFDAHYNAILFCFCIFLSLRSLTLTLFPPHEPALLPVLYQGYQVPLRTLLSTYHILLCNCIVPKAVSVFAHIYLPQMDISHLPGCYSPDSIYLTKPFNFLFHNLYLNGIYKI